MPFVQTASWDHRLTPSSSVAQPPARPLQNSFEWRGYGRKTTALAATAAVHLTLLLILATKVQVGATQELRQPGTSLSVFDVSDPAPPSLRQQQSPKLPPPPAPATTPPPPPLIQPREWQAVKIAAPIAQAGTAVAPATAAASSAGATGAASAAPGGGFDPYAGAAAKPFDNRVTSAAPAIVEMTDASLRATLSACLRQQSGAQSPTALSIAVFTDGSIFDIAASNRTQAAAVRQCASTVTGKRLARTTPPRARDLRWVL